MNNLDFVIDRSRKEGISDMGNAYFPSHFLGAVCGWPGSGKTTLIKYILKSPALLYDKFDEILILSPSIAEWKDLFLPSMNLANDLDFSFITNHIKRINEENRKNYVNVLIIFDDLIAQMAKNSNSEQIRKLAFNRRHLIDNGMISILVTSQKFNLLPTSMRSNLTFFITYALNNIDWELIMKQIIRVDSDLFKDIIKYVFVGVDDFLIYRVDENKFFKKFEIINTN